MDDCLCPLCLETCRVPVEITGFPCYSPDTIHCHTMIRYCKACCIHLFELDRPPHERKQYLKCLYCDANMNPQSLATWPFRTDHFLIRRDVAQDIPCPRCDYCAPNHQHLEKHCGETCPHKVTMVEEEKQDMVVCAECDKCTLLCMNEHLETECMMRWVPCKYCKEKVKALYFTDHLLLHREESRSRCQLLQEILSKEREWGQRILQESREFYGEMFQETM